MNPLFRERRKPINQDAANVLRRVPQTPIKPEGDYTARELEQIRWAGLISKCPKCGDRAYEHGHCFGCGRRLGVGDGLRKDE